METGAIRFVVASESRSLRPAIEANLGWSTGSDPWDEGLFITQPASASEVARAMWVLDESGGITLRRSPDESVVVNSALFHLLCLESALTTEHLALRLRAILLPDGTALLVEPRVVHELSGMDRKLLRRGVRVLPTTISIVDEGRSELVVPPQEFEPDVVPGRYPISRILLARTEEDLGMEAASVLHLTSNLLRVQDQDLRTPLKKMQKLVSTSGERIRRLTVDQIEAEIRLLGAPGK